MKTRQAVAQFCLAILLLILCCIGPVLGAIWPSFDDWWIKNLFYIVVCTLPLLVISYAMSGLYSPKTTDKTIAQQLRPKESLHTPIFSEVKPGRRSIPQSVRFNVLKHDKYRCQICGRTVQDDGVKLEVDHKQAVAKGGKDDMSNLWTLCFDCNRGKSDKDL